MLQTSRRQPANWISSSGHRTCSQRICGILVHAASPHNQCEDCRTGATRKSKGYREANLSLQKSKDTSLLAKVLQHQAVSPLYHPFISTPNLLPITGAANQHIRRAAASTAVSISAFTFRGRSCEGYVFCGRSCLVCATQTTPWWWRNRGQGDFWLFIHRRTIVCGRPLTVVATSGTAEEQDQGILRGTPERRSAVRFLFPIVVNAYLMRTCRCKDLQWLDKYGSAAKAFSSAEPFLDVRIPNGDGRFFLHRSKVLAELEISNYPDTSRDHFTAQRIIVQFQLIG